MLSPDELIKALKSCAKSDCDSCPLKGYESYDECTAALAADALGHYAVQSRVIVELSRAIDRLEGEKKDENT